MQEIHRNQIWIYKESKIINGNIQNGSRPVIIISNDIGNRYSPIVIAVPCTSKIKKWLPVHYSFYFNEIENTALCEQIFTCNKFNLVKCIGELNCLQVEEFNDVLKKSIGLSIIEPIDMNKKSY